MRESLSESVISASGLVKRFGRTRALDGLDLLVRAGEVHGFLGPNGAGKSTTIRALLGQLRLDGGQLGPGALGRVELEALDQLVAATDIASSLETGEQVDALASGQPRPQHRVAGDVCQVGVHPHRVAHRVETEDLYSKGNRQKVALIAALSSGAPLLVLDEPTSGLDPLMEEAFQTTIRELRSEGATVLLSSHILDEVEELCDRVTIIRAGRTVSTGSLDDLRAGTRTTIRATTSAVIAGIEGYAATVESVGGLVHTTLSVGREDVARAVTVVAAAGPSALVVRPPSLDELFLGHYGETA
ncbi:MAG: ATP-binding cassette domain-containing protein [Micrococcales bacterium]|nr:ATP-binding cassette domain-containing protein [Micrococcales bacterium]